MHKYSGKGKITKKHNNQCDIEMNSFMLGPPGSKGELIATADLGQTRENDINRINDTSIREFEVIASLSKKIEYSIDLKGSIDVKDGESFWQIKKEAISSKLKTRVGLYTLSVNDKKEISKIEYKCKTTSFQKAQNLFYLGITPILDVLSFKANIPLIISRVICIDLKYTITSIIYEAPHHSITIPPFTENIIEELLPIYALYRESKINVSSYYKFLCLYKILEGIYSNLRPKLIQKSKKININIRCKKEIIPDHFLIREYNKDFVGMKIRKLYDDILRKEFRNAVAHFKLKDGTLLNLTDYNTNRKFAGILFLTEMCCRILIDNHSDMYFQLYSKDQIDVK